MQLRRMSGFRSVRIGLVAVMLAMAMVMAVPPAGYAVVEKPKPDALWEAFPLEPAPERASTPVPSAPQPSTSPYVPPSAGRSEATTVTNANAPSEASGPGIIVIALAATLLLLVATVSVLSGRRLYTGKRHRRTTVPLWQGAALPLTSDFERQRHGAGVRTGSAPIVHEPRAGEPDLLGPLYRWLEVEKPPVGRPRPSLGSEIRRQVHRIRRVVWNQDIAPAIIGAAAAMVAGILVVYLIG